VAVSVQNQLAPESLTVRCDGCSKSATTDAFARDAFLEMIGWHVAQGDVLCSSCQADRGMTLRFGTVLRRGPGTQAR
jgi:hypothetical protein